MVMRPILPVAVVAPVLLALLALFLFRTVRRERPAGQKILRVLRVAAILALVFLINLRIQHKRYDMDVEMKNIDILFVVDTTISMWAEDGSGYRTRMEQVIADCRYVMEEMAGGNFALIRFDNRAQILAPFTQDRKNVTDALTTIRMPNTYYANGSSLNVPLDAMEELLLSSAEKKERSTVVFFLSDGEITDGSTLASYEFLEEYVDAGAVLGYGTQSGAKMKEEESWGTVYLQDPETGEDAVSRLDEETLRMVAADLDVDYIRMRAPEDLSYLLDSIKAGSTVALSEEDAVVYDDTYYYYVIPLAGLLLWELILFLRRRRI